LAPRLRAGRLFFEGISWKKAWIAGGKEIARPAKFFKKVLARAVT
jgi:hypothetical protein